MKKLGALVLISSIFCSCKTEELYLTVNEPAPVSVPASIKKVGIVNRSIFSDSNETLKNIDQVLSVKGKDLDKDCSLGSMKGLRDALIANNRFSAVDLLDSVKLKNNFPGVLPIPLSWDKIAQICQKYDVDALFSLELFHTDSKVNISPNMGAIMSGGGANIITRVNTGWRIYDPQDKLILDEYPVTQSVSFGGDPLDIAMSLMNHKEAIMGVSYNIGQYYAGRILPYSIRVCREYYVKGTENFIIARRMAEAGDWNGAAELWKKETTNPKAKVQARAYYNMAISCEINGDVDAAIDWAQKAYIISGKRLDLHYLNILKDRKAENDLLKSQVGQ